MKKILSLTAVLLFLAPAAFAAVVENWGGVAPGSNTGTYVDTNGSKIDFAVDAGPKDGKALKITSHLAQGGYCGIWHNLTADLSKAGAMKFMAKSTISGEVQIALKDTFHVQYIAKAKVGSAWSEVSVPLSNFHKDPYLKKYS